MKEFDSQEKIEAMKEVFSSLNIRDHSEEKTEIFFQQAMYSLDKIDVPEENKTGLKNFAQALMVREV